MPPRTIGILVAVVTLLGIVAWTGKTRLTSYETRKDQTLGCYHYLREQGRPEPNARTNPTADYRWTLQAKPTPTPAYCCIRQYAIYAGWQWKHATSERNRISGGHGEEPD